MDMQIDPNRIRTERERRAWSQEHLAEVAGLSLRTIQRVETTGSASYETVKSIAAVLGLDVAELRVTPVAAVGTVPRRWRYVGLAASLLVAVGALFFGVAHAGEVLLDVGVTLNQEKRSRHQIVATEGKSAEIRLEGQVRVFVNPIVTADGSILLSMRVEEPEGSRWVEFAEPRIMVGNGVEGLVQITSPKGNVFEISVRPNRR
jgi:transcriptional regulator with XRE-family HTH domain